MHSSQQIALHRLRLARLSPLVLLTQCFSLLDDFGVRLWLGRDAVLIEETLDGMVTRAGSFVLAVVFSLKLHAFLLHLLVGLKVSSHHGLFKEVMLNRPLLCRLVDMGRTVFPHDFFGLLLLGSGSGLIIEVDRVSEVAFHNKIKPAAFFFIDLYTS